MTATGPLALFYHIALLLVGALLLGGCISVHKVNDHLSIVTFDGVGTAPSITLATYDGKPVYSASEGA